jgi:ubiquitin-activating enzyme E1
MFDYIVATANLHAFNYGLKGKSDPEFFKKVLAEIEVPEFQPKEGVKIQVNENEPVANESSEFRYWSFRRCNASNLAPM